MTDEQTFHIQKLGKALEVSQRTIQSLEKKVADASQIIQILEKEKQQWEQQKKLQEMIIKQQLSTADEKVRGLEKKIMELRARLKAAA